MRHFLNALQTGDLSDLKLRVSSYKNDNEKVIKELKVHKAILAGGSPVFERMIFGSMSNYNNEVIDIYEEDYNLFYMFLQGVYTRGTKIDFSSLNDEDIKSLLEIAHRYLVTQIVDECASKLIPQEISRKAFEAFNLACLFDIKTLKLKCVELFQEHAAEVFAHERFLSLSAEALRELLKQDSLNINSELEVFEAVIKWCQNVLYNDGNLTMSAYITDNNNLYSFIKKESIDSDDVLMETDSRDSGIVLNGITEDIKRTEAVISYKQFERSSLAESTICESRQNSELVKEYGKNIRKILIDFGLLNNIRFLTFNPEDFTTITAVSEIFSTLEIKNILFITTLLKSKNSYSRSVAEGMIKNNNKDLKDINVSITPRFKVTEENCPGGVVMLDFFVRGFLWIPAQDPCPEKFKCTSKIPIIIESIILPSKDKTVKTAVRYEELVYVVINTLTEEHGSFKEKLVYGLYRARREFGADFEYCLQYNLYGRMPVLQEGEWFLVNLRFVKCGDYYGGFRYEEPSFDHDVISVSREQYRGVIRGFRYKYITS